MSKRVLALLTVFVLLIPQLLGCAGAPQMPPATVSAPEAAVEAAPTEVAPTMAPTPVDTPTPLPPLPPRVVSWAPERGEELGVAQPVVLQFDQPMDRASVEQAWRIAPAIEGAIEWRDERTVAFVPAGAGFQRGSQYVVTLDASAQSAAGLRLQDDLRLSLRSAGYLEVAEVYPQPDTLDVDTNSPIRVAFNRPVVPLTSVGQMTGLPDPLAFSPPVEGQGSWVNTSIYSFQPSEGLAAGTLYTVRVSAGLQGVGDAVLAKDYAWSFTTKMPDLVSVYPGPDRRHIAPTGPVRLVFNQAMDTASVEERFSLVHSGTLRPVAGTFSWEAAAAQFAPAEPFERGAAYRIRLEKGSLSASGGAAMASTYAWQFTVAELPKVLAIKPRDGQTKVSTGAAIEVTFSSPISTTTFTKAFTITPPVGSWTYWGSDDTVAYVHPWLSPSTWYTVTLTRGILDRYGVPLEAETTVRFQTEPYEPMVSLIVPDRVGSYNAYSTPVANIEYRNVSRVDLSLYRVSSETFIALNGEDAWQEWDRFEPKSQDLVRRWSLPAEAALNVLGSVPVPLTPSEGASLPSGLYYLRVSAPEARYTQKHLLVVSPLNLTLKTSTSEALVWATDLSTGQPVSGVNLTIY
ncbi:MAG: hypothetical protein FJZ90_17070, partial [Chloroflexi bacterium]|nr:hypothetical protein [Chloroflexota bacterium]